MREKYESLPLATLRDLAKAREMTGISTLKKAELIEAMLEQDEKDKLKNEKAELDIEQLDSGETVEGILEVMENGYGFIRSDNYLPGENDIYVSPSQIRRFGLKTGDILTGNTRIKTQQEKFSALLYVTKINGYTTEEAMKRKNFEDLTPIFPDERLHLESGKSSVAMRIVDLLSPIGKGQRGMIVSPPKAGKTTLLKQVAQALLRNNPDMHILILLIDERPEEVTDIKESIMGTNVEVIYSTFDELPEHHKRVSEMTIERAKRLVEAGKDTVLILDSLTKVVKACNARLNEKSFPVGEFSPNAFLCAKKIFGSARHVNNGASLTIIASVEAHSGSVADEYIYSQFKDGANTEIVLNKALSQNKLFPAIDIKASGTRREELLLSGEEIALSSKLKNLLDEGKAYAQIYELFNKTQSNAELLASSQKLIGEIK